MANEHPVLVLEGPYGENCCGPYPRIRIGQNPRLGYGSNWGSNYPTSCAAVSTSASVHTQPFQAASLCLSPPMNCHVSPSYSHSFRLLGPTQTARNVQQAWILLEGKVCAQLIDGTTVAVYNIADIWAVETMHMDTDQTCKCPATALHLFYSDPEAPYLPQFPWRRSSSSDAPISDMFGFSIWGRPELILIPPREVHQDVTCAPIDSAFSVARLRWRTRSQVEEMERQEESEGPRALFRSQAKNSQGVRLQ